MRICSVLFSHSVVSNSVTSWTAACQASLSITDSRSLLKLMSMKSVMPSNHLILCPPLLLLPSIFPSIRVFPYESVLCIRWPKYWSFSFSISPSVNIQDWFPLGWTGWISLHSKGLSRVFSNTTVQKYEDRPIEKIIESRDRPTHAHSNDFQLNCQDNSIASVFLINDIGTTEYWYGSKPKVSHIQKLI